MKLDYTVGKVLTAFASAARRRAWTLMVLLLASAGSYAANTISVVNPTCNQIYPTGTYSVKVNYTADQTSKIVVFLLHAPTGYAYWGEGTITVPAGSGSVIVNVAVSGTAPVRSGYGFYAKLRTLNDTEVANGSGSDVSVVANPGISNAISITNFPSSIAAAGTGTFYDITVNFSANQKGKVVVTLENEIFTVKGRGEYAFNGCGTGTSSTTQVVRVTLSEPTTGNSTYNLFAKVLDENGAEKAFAGKNITVTGTAPGSPRTFYVSPTGSNANNGTSTSTPFQTIQYAASQTYPGDVVLVMAGTYGSPNAPILGAVTIFRSGTATQPIVYKAYDMSNRPKIKISRGSGIYTSASYIEINGFIVEGGAAEIDPAYAQYLYDNDRDNSYINADGISASYNQFIVRCAYPHHIKMLNNEVYNMPGNGIATGRADYITIDRNQSHDNAKWGPYANSGISVYQGRDIDNNTDYKYIISNNISYNNYNNFRNVATGTVTDGNGIIIDDFKNTQNFDANCPQPAQPYLYTGKILVYNNITYNNGGSGIHTFLSNNVDIIHNVAYKNGTHPDLSGEIFSNASTRVRILNNVKYALTGENVNFDFSNDSSVEYNYNIYYDGTANPTYTRSLANNIIADPQFVNPGARDFRLKTASPAINAGTSAAMVSSLLNRDYDNNTRPNNGTLPDIGAFETTGTSLQSLKIEAEGYCAQSGLNTWSTGFGDINANDYAKYCGVNLSTGYNRLTFNLATPLSGTIYVRLGSTTGTTIGTLNFTSTGDWGTYQQQTITLSGASGTQDVFLVGGSGTINLDWIQFSNSTGARVASKGDSPGSTIRVFPNPASRVVYVQSAKENAGARSVVLTDMLGRDVMRKEFAAGEMQQEIALDVSRVAEGTYMLTICEEGRKQVKRITVLK